MVSGSGEGAGPGLQVRALEPQPRGQDRCSSGRSSVFGSPCSLDMDLTPSTVGAETSSLGVWKVRCEIQWPNFIFKDISYLFFIFIDLGTKDRWQVFLFPEIFSITVDIQYRFVLVSGAPHSVRQSCPSHSVPRTPSATWPDCRARVSVSSSSRVSSKRGGGRQPASALLSCEREHCPVLIDPSVVPVAGRSFAAAGRGPLHSFSRCVPPVGLSLTHRPPTDACLGYFRLLLREQLQ